MKMLYSTSLGLALLFLSLAAGCGANATDALKSSPGEAMVRTELFFGMDRADGDDVTDDEWQAFVNDEVTPRFPAGLTVLHASGQWRDPSGAVIHENSRVLILLRSADSPKEVEQSIEEIRKTYAERFHQDAVLRVDSVVRAAF